MFPELQLLTINAFLPQHIQERFNRKLEFGGPNCFNTALAATDGIDCQETRHVSFNEFKARLGLLYTEIQTKNPEPGDVLLYNSSEHGAVYIGGERVFRLFQHGKPTLILSPYSAGLTSLLIINTNHRTFLNCSTNRHNKSPFCKILTPPPLTENLLVPLEIFLFFLRMTFSNTKIVGNYVCFKLQQIDYGPENSLFCFCVPVIKTHRKRILK